MRPQDFRKIEEYFKKSGLSTSSARFAFIKFIENVEFAMKKSVEKNNGREPTEQEISQICDQYLTDPILNGYIDIAKIDEDTEKSNLEEKYRKRGGAKSFFVSIVISIMANFLFLIIILLSFKFGKDQWQVIITELDLVVQTADVSVANQTPNGVEVPNSDGVSGNE